MSGAKQTKQDRANNAYIFRLSGDNVNVERVQNNPFKAMQASQTLHTYIQ